MKGSSFLKKRAQKSAHEWEIKSNGEKSFLFTNKKLANS
jgi:hypothetical protein